MTDGGFQSQCELGQEQLMRMEYLQAEATLAQVEEQAWKQKDFDTLARVYMPLQEVRRQRRQRCGEGVVNLRLLAEGPDDRVEAQHVVEKYPHGQLLVAGWGLIAPAAEVRRLAREQQLYVETFLGAAYPMGEGRVIAIVPTTDVALPETQPRSLDDLIRKLPPHSVVLSERELPQIPHRGDSGTHAQVMALWERLHSSFLAAADMQVDLVKKIEGYRKAIRVDYACELAHQKASDAVYQLLRAKC